MIKKISVLLLAVVLTGCVFPHKATIDENFESIPPEVALTFLQSDESAGMAGTPPCAYTRYGIMGRPYNQLEFIVRNVWGSYSLEVWNRGTAKLLLRDPDNLICRAIVAGGWDGLDYTAEQVDEMVNKTASALLSLGVEYNKFGG
jgi:hypothetical protein